MNEVVSTIKLTKVYGRVRAVDSLNLCVKRGEIFGFLGPNGAGKTTTIRMLLGMVSPTSGRCYLQGKKVSAGSTALWNDVGYMVETPYSYPELTVKENLDIVRRLRDIGDNKCIEWIVDKLKLREYVSTKAGHLSTGNAQRLGIAKALIHRPKILILDEPTNRLDPAGIIEVREFLQGLAKNFGVTILVSSHRLDEISRLATNIAIVHQGKLIKEVDGKGFDRELKKTLVIGGKKRDAMMSIISKAGYEVENINGSPIDCMPVLLIKDRNALEDPESIVALLVNAGYPPNLVKVEREDLESYFIRTIKEAGGNIY
jgi:ABC-2 type transport system ATP-binding protein